MYILFFCFFFFPFFQILGDKIETTEAACAVETALIGLCVHIVCLSAVYTGSGLCADSGGLGLRVAL